MTYTSNVDLGQLIVTGVVGFVGAIVVWLARMVRSHFRQVNGDHKKLRYVAEVVDHHSHVFLQTNAGEKQSFRRVSTPGPGGDYDDVIKANS